MIAEINYSGIASCNSPFDAADGQLSVALNCINENGALRPILSPKHVLNLADNIQCLHIHIVGTVKKYILYDVSDRGLLFTEGDADSMHPIVTPNFDEILSVSSIGNSLIVLTDLGMLYYLWQNNSFSYLGMHMPELNLSFSLSNAGTVASDIFEVSGGYSSNGDSDEIIASRNAVRNAALGSVKNLFGKASEKHYFIFPFFIRYAFRLFDGSLAMHSAPILMVSSINKSVVCYPGWKNITNSGRGSGAFGADSASITSSATMYQIKCAVSDAVGVRSRLSDWKNIINSVDIFISRQLFNIDSEASPDDIRIADIQRNEILLPKSDIAPDIRDNSSFYLLKSFSIEEIFDFADAGEDFVINPDFAVNNDSIVVREAMSDDFNSHNSLIPLAQHTYNSRLNIANLKELLFDGFSPDSLYFSAEFSNAVEATYFVEYQSDDGKLILSNPYTKSVILDENNDILWFYYPSARAKHVIFCINGVYRRYILTPHSFLNGAYFFLYENASENTVVTRPSPTPASRAVSASYNGPAEIVDCPVATKYNFIYRPNSVFTSQVNNPFYFPVLGINTIGSGKITAITSATKALSQGQFGQFPLYALTTDGIWALEPAADGSFITKQAISRDVCINAKSVTQLDSAVAFASARGIMLLQGSETVCLSDSLGTDSSFHAYDLGEKAINALLYVSGLQLAADKLLISPFKDYVASCRLSFDYVHQRIFVFNPSSLYHYVFSLKSQMWGMFFASDLKYSINSYPDALVVKGNDVVNFSDYKSNYQQILVITSPIKLSSPDDFKSIRSIVQHGFFSSKEEFTQVLFGSRDLRHWLMITPAHDNFLRAVVGTPFKYFRIAFTATLGIDDSISSASIEFSTKYTNKLR